MFMNESLIWKRAKKESEMSTKGGRVEVGRIYGMTSRLWGLRCT
jgi:hypothetical protein